MSEIPIVVEEAQDDFDAVIEILDNAGDRLTRFRAQTRLVASNASMLILAAIFEEAARQLGVAFIRAYFAAPRTGDVRAEALRKELWERSSRALSNNQYGNRNFDSASALVWLSVLNDGAMAGLDLSNHGARAMYNDRNMRVSELNKLFAKVGFDSMSQLIGRSIEFRRFFLANSVGEASQDFENFLNEFYDKRNEATHDLANYRSGGSVDVRRYAEFLKLTVQKAGSVLEAALP